MGDDVSAYSGALRRRYESATASIGIARGDADQWLAAHQYAVASREVLALVVSELLSNAVQASNAPFDMEIAAVDSAHVGVTVANRPDESSMPDRADWGPDDVLAARGRGLAIVDALAESVAVDEQPDRVTITAVVQVERRQVTDEG